jgi:tRNA 2-selenouridine synthase
MAASGFQTLDLEGLAHHRGSLLGGYRTPQPTQKWFESQVFHQLDAMDPDRPIWLESESSKIGQLHVPEQLFQRMLRSPAFALEASLEARSTFLCDVYQDMQDDPERFRVAIAALQFRQSRQIISQWLEWVDTGQWQRLSESLLALHYDPAYGRSQHRLRVCDSMSVTPGELSTELMHRLEQFEHHEHATTQASITPTGHSLLDS